MGCKDQLVQRVLLLRQGRTATMLVKEEQELKELIKIIQLIFAQRFLKLSTRIYRKRTYHITSTASFLPVPVSTHSETDLTDLFLPLLDYVALQHDQRAAQDERNTISLVDTLKTKTSAQGDLESLQQQLVEVGAKIKVKWSSEEIGDSAGWYVAYVQGYDSDLNLITLHYQSEPDCTYTVELTPLLRAGTIKLVQAVI